MTLENPYPADPFEEEITPRQFPVQPEPIFDLPVDAKTNKYTLTINVGMFSNLIIELNNLTTEGKKDIVEKIEMAKKLVSKFGLQKAEVK